MLQQAQGLNHFHGKQSQTQVAPPTAEMPAHLISATAAKAKSSTHRHRKQHIAQQPIPVERSPERAVDDAKEQGPGFRHDLHELHELDVEEVVQTLIHEPAPEGIDGTSVARSLFPTGELKGESWYLPTGEHIQRAFYQSGQIEGLSWVLADGTTLVVKLKPNGNYSGQREEFTNGEKTITKYDDAGRIAERWQVKSNGQRIKVL